MNGYLMYANYRVIDDKTYIELFGRLENGKSFCTVQEMEPHFFIKTEKVSKNKPYLSKFNVESTKLKTFDEKEVSRISHPSQTELNKLAVVLIKKDVETYEADLKPHTRYLIDHDIKGTLSIEGEKEQGERVDVMFKNITLKPALFKPSLKIVSIDLESDKSGDALYCIGIYTEDYQHVFMVTDKKIKDITSCKNERECLEKWKQKMVELDPDIITGWNITDFDFPFLKKLFERHKLEFDLGRTNEETRMRISNDFFRDSTVTIPGRQVIDALNLIQDPFIKEAPTIKNIEIDSWTLEDVSQAILGKGKLLVGKERHEKITEWYEKGKHKELADYNLQDCRLVYELLEKTKTIELAVERSQMTGMSLDKITASVAAFDSLYIREARKRGFVSPSNKYTQKEERIKGGYVMDSKPNIYHNLLVLDFKSLYPSLIRTFNIDPASHVEKARGTIEAPNGAHFKNTDGILPSIIERLHQEREKAKKEKREFASYAIKIIMNSFFGVLANPNCRYFSLEVANAITHFGQHIIKLTAEKVKEKGYEVIYSDTDAVFIDTKIEDSKKAFTLGKELQEYINTFYEKYVKEEYDRKSYLEIELKRLYLSFLLPPLRTTDKGSKKRYAGLYENNGKEELEIVGLEAIRGDWTEAAQDFQRELLMHIFKRKEFIAFIKEYVKKIQAGKLDAKLVYTKSLRKGLEDYTKTTPPHVKAARKLPSLESNTIQYYITTDGPEPIQKLQHSLDYDHYIDKQIKPIANTVLFFFHKTFDDIMNDSKQAKLFS